MVERVENISIGQKEENKTFFLQKTELDMLKEFLRICDKYHLQYFMAGGTFLGAVRHSGFIPWDDDIDIGMFRKDYDKFLEISETELKEPYRIQTYKNTETHHYYFSHIVDTRYKVKRLGSIDKREEYVWIDIFPYDGLPKGFIKEKTTYIKLLFYRFCYHMANFEKINLERKDRAFWQKVLLKILFIGQKIVHFDKRKWIDKIDKNLKAIDLEQSNVIMSFMGVKLIKEIFPKEKYIKLRKYEFEKLSLWGPQDYDYVLKQLYGDYMKLHPIQNRNSHPMQVVECEIKE